MTDKELQTLKNQIISEATRLADDLDRAYQIIDQMAVDIGTLIRENQELKELLADKTDYPAVEGNYTDIEEDNLPIVEATLDTEVR